MNGTEINTRENDLFGRVEEWAKVRGIDRNDPSKQMLKVVEEVGEVAAALARGDQEELMDGIGDSIVTLIILAQQSGMDALDCLNAAYNVIAKRKGKVVNGVFVKEEDLQEDDRTLELSVVDKTEKEQINDLIEEVSIDELKEELICKEVEKLKSIRSNHLKCGRAGLKALSEWFDTPADPRLSESDYSEIAYRFTKEVKQYEKN
ncbi:hypothetical protein CBF29_06430 [Vagococcus elongatus]|uniref:NTP pyrophosphohydrolase MazG-like domain-containing protein n=1 Tax=Vagococcus elongatus TaxID=180344 RepID=A0A430AW90_9ENTE|nr:hypothetical protein CBF29_06430 [Vagococcus elongatus]